jgi:hypothetical protein
MFKKSWVVMADPGENCRSLGVHEILQFYYIDEIEFFGVLFVAW